MKLRRFKTVFSFPSLRMSVLIFALVYAILLSFTLIYVGKTLNSPDLPKPPVREDFVLEVNSADEKSMARQGKIGKIPKIIHQTWIDTSVPNRVIDYILSWKNRMPSWEYWFWTDIDILEYVKTRHPNFLSTFMSYETPIMKADAFRYLVLQDIGGVYADIDMELLKPLYNLTDRHSCIIPQEPLEHSLFLFNVTRVCSNALLASAPGHPFFSWLVRKLPEIASRVPRDNVQEKTGPRMLERAVTKYFELELEKRYPIYVAPPEEFMPQYDADQDWFMLCRGEKLEGLKKKICEELEERGFQEKPVSKAYTNHHWIHLWAPWNSRTQGSSTSIDEIVPNRVDVMDRVKKLSD